MDFMKPESVLDLQNIRSALIRMEDTILFDLIERAQFHACTKVYDHTSYESLGNNSFLEWMLKETERIHSEVRRYEAPDENPFYPQVLAGSLLPPLEYPKVLADYHKEVSVNNEILSYYVSTIVPKIAASKAEQPENYGSCTICDIQALQAISRRIHFGKFVAEAKFQQEKEKLTERIKAKDCDGILALITKPEVEKKVLERVREKAENYNLDPQTSLRWSQSTQGKVNPQCVVEIYETCIIPFTKKVEVDYLLRRLECP